MLAGFTSKTTNATTAGLLSRRKRAHKSGIYTACKYCKAKGNERLSLIIQTLCGTGIRVSELKFITIEAVKCGESVVSLKGKTRSVSLDNTSYFDGAMIDNIPVYPLLKHNLDYIICIYFDDTCYKFENTYFDNKVIKIFFPCNSMLKQSLVFNKQSIDDMIKGGYDRATYILKNILSEGYDNLNSIYRSIDFMNQNNRNSSLRITGDVLVTNLNKITQRLTKRKIL